MSEADMYLMVLGIVIGAMTLIAYGAGKGTHNLARMEITAAVNTAKQEVGWEYQRYRIESMRMDWCNMSVDGRREYMRLYGRPKWADSVNIEDPLKDIPKVHMVRGRTG